MLERLSIDTAHAAGLGHQDLLQIQDLADKLSVYQHHACKQVTLDRFFAPRTSS